GAGVARVRSREARSAGVAPGSTYAPLPHSQVVGSAPIRVIAGAVVSCTVTVRAAEVPRPAASLALKLSVVVPTTPVSIVGVLTICDEMSPSHRSTADAPGSTYGPLPHSVCTELAPRSVRVGVCTGTSVTSLQVWSHAR